MTNYLLFYMKYQNRAVVYYMCTISDWMSEHLVRLMHVYSPVRTEQEYSIFSCFLQSCINVCPPRCNSQRFLLGLERTLPPLNLHKEALYKNKL